MKTELAQVKWGDELRDLFGEDATAWLTKTIIRAVGDCVASKLNSKSHEAFRVKRAARGTASYSSARDLCFATFLQTLQDYVGKTKETLKTMNISFCGWWRAVSTRPTKAG